MKIGRSPIDVGALRLVSHSDISHHQDLKCEQEHSRHKKCEQELNCKQEHSGHKKQGQKVSAFGCDIFTLVDIGGGGSKIIEQFNLEYKFILKN